MSETIEVLSAVHGIAPRSDDLLKLGADLERGRVSQETFDDQIASETADWLALQAEAGIDIQENGKLKWQDHLRPIVKATNGFAPGVDEGAVTRWPGENRFYRQPVIVDRLRLDSERLTAEIGELGENISLLAPNSFAALCEDRYPELPAARNVFQLYSDLLFYFEEHGVKRITFEDYHGDEDSLDNVEVLASWGDAKLAFIRPGGQAAVPYNPAQNLGVSIEAGHWHTIASLPTYRQPELEGSEIWRQVIDSAITSHIEPLFTDKEIRQLADFAPARLVLTHTVDFDGQIPLKQAREKVLRLGEYATDVRDRLEAIS